MLKLSCLPPWASARQQATPLPVVRWLQGAGFCVFQTLNLLHWVRPDPSRRHRFIRSRESRNTVTTGPVGRGGLAGARKRLACQQHFSDPTRFSGTLETGHLHRGHSLTPGSTRLADSSKPIVPASPNRPAVPDAQCPLHLKLYRLECFCRWCGQPTERSQL